MSFDELSLRPFYALAIIEDRYTGTYSGGRFIAIANAFDEEHAQEYDGEIYPCRFNLVHDMAHDGDPEASNFWHYVRENDFPWVAVGDTPNAAVEALQARSKRK